MELAKQIDVAPKNGDFIVLQDACSRELGRWAQETNGWVQPDGSPVRISPTHWTRLSDDLAGATDRERFLFLLLPPEDDEIEQIQKRPLTRLILAFATAISFSLGFVFWIGSEHSISDNSAADPEREFSRERNRAFADIGSLSAARDRENVALTEALESKRIANSKQIELMQEARSEALARELASVREDDVVARNLAAARERENAAQALEAKQIADARQKELKQALDESEKRAFALERELASARKTIASAEKSSDAKVTARDAPAPTGPLNRPMEGSNAASDITASITTPQSVGTATAGVQASSDAAPADATTTAGASGRLTRSNRSQPGRPQPPSAISSAEEARDVARAKSMIKKFNFASARLLLAHALDKGSARAAFMLAETYDGNILRSLRAYGVREDAAMALEFYQLAAAAGIEKAQERVEALQSDANVDTHVGEEKRGR